MCLLFENRKEGITEQTAEKGITEFPFEVVFFIYGDSRKDAEGLPEDGKAAKGNQKSNSRQPQSKVIRGKAQQICTVCHFQKAAAKPLQGICGKWQEKQKF